MSKISEEISKLAAEYAKERAEDQNAFARAFCEFTGMRPDECVMCETVFPVGETGLMVRRVWFEKKDSAREAREDGG